METVGDELFKKIHALTLRQLEESITPGEHRELEALLVDSDAARSVYAEYVQEAACLRWGCQEEIAEAVECSIALPQGIELPTARRRAEIFALLASLACTVAFVGFGWLYSRWSNLATAPAGNVAIDVAASPQPDADVVPPATRAPDGRSATESAQQVATITGLGSARWLQGADAARLLSRCGVGDRFQLEEGTAELTFDAGVQVTVFAPADFEITSAMSIRCLRGRVTTLVDERGKGFTIETPKATVEDLGTQFGVDIADDGETKVIVFRGSVDVTYPSDALVADGEASRRLEQGDALLFNNLGEHERLMAVRRDQFLGLPGSGSDRPPVIIDVHDNIRKDHSVKSYQIVHDGMDEDVPCFVDRDHEWNGIDKSGLPNFLRGADYVMPFNDDKFVRSLELTIYVSRPATLYIFLDNNMELPAWLRKGFMDTGVDIGLDGAPTIWHQDNTLATGAGQSIDFTFSIWQCAIRQPGAITLGGVKPPPNRPLGFNMYGVAAVATEFVTE